ncbi:hypothetical protein HPB47_007426 [Ixodes persulcatus]|uniref:Uncharacterized protein n=1 Tax=Ixodes persulcatus TaxID=34615 RepID=A0AC60P8E9_IXOPE|nr:hypothetical protein HPB47_007426 [Ixodes persulcatus]
MRCSIIANCFKHAGFVEKVTSSTGAAEDCDEQVSPPPGISAAWQALQEAGNVPADIQLEEFIGVDACVIVREELSDEQIVRSVREAENSSDGEDDGAPDAPTPTSTSQVMDAFDIVRKFIGAHDDDVAMALLTECENRVAPLLTAKRKQAKLTDFWH